MFGRDLVEQVEADAKGSDRQVPVLVEKCIEAVETRGMFFLCPLAIYSFTLP